MDDRETRVETTDTRKRRGGAGRWLWPLLILLLLLLLLWWLFSQNMNNNNSQQNTTDTSQNQNRDQNNDQQAFKAQFEDQFAVAERTILFNPDTVEFEDEMMAEEKLDAIAQFAEQNPEAKLEVNGSIFEDDQSDAASDLARQRAELVRDRLVEKGVSEDRLTVSTLDRYEGQDDAARAEYARSAVIQVTN